MKVPFMLTNKKYDDSEWNCETFWESIVVDYAMRGYPVEFSQFKQRQIFNISIILQISMHSSSYHIQPFPS